MPSAGEEEHSWDSVSTWDSDKRQWRRHKRDVELLLRYREAPIGARLLAKITGAVKKFAETFNLKISDDRLAQTRSTGTEWTLAVKHLMGYLGRANGSGGRNEEGYCKNYFYKELERRPSQSMAEWVKSTYSGRAACLSKDKNVRLVPRKVKLITPQ